MTEVNFLQVLFPCPKCQMLVRMNVDGTYKEHLCFAEPMKCIDCKQEGEKGIKCSCGTFVCESCASILSKEEIEEITKYSESQGHTVEIIH